MILFSCFLIQHTNVITETFFVLQKMYLHLKQEASNTFWKCEMVEDYHCAASHLHFLKMRSHATARCGLGHSLTETINTLPVKHLGMTAYMAPKPVCKAGFSINGAFTDVMVCHVHYILSHNGVKVRQRPPLQRIQWNFSSFSDWACNSLSLWVIALHWKATAQLAWW